MRRATVAALALVVAGALWLSGSSTLRLGAAHHVPALALPALVVVLEVASVIGTALWVTAGQAGRSRTKPALVVLLASSVAAVGGWQAYGWLGLVAPFAVVLVTDMVAERWDDLEQERTGPAGTAPGPALEAPVLEPDVESPGELAELEVDAETTPLVDPVPTDRSGPGTAPWSDEDVLADLHARGEVDPSPRSLRSFYGMRHDRAVRLVAEHADRADRSASTEVGTPAGTGVTS